MAKKSRGNTEKGIKKEIFLDNLNIRRTAFIHILNNKPYFFISNIAY